MARIGIDATNVQPLGKGISRYQKNIIRALAQLDLRHEFFVFHRPSVKDELITNQSNWHFIPVPFLLLSLWEQAQLPWLVKKYRLDLMYTTSDRLPLWSSVPFVIHLFEIPTYRVTSARRAGYQTRWYQRLAEAYNLAVFPRSLKKAVRIIASSAFTKKDLINQYHVSEQKIQVIYAAHEDSFQPARDPKMVARIRTHVSGGSEYVLHFSSGDPRDNTPVVLKVFEKVKARLPFDVKLIIVGANGTKGHGARLDPALAPSVKRISFVPDRKLIELYQGASLYMDPSLYEGFGFQLLEAMACGVPVVASNVTAIPEIMQGAGLLIEPNDVGGISDAVARVLTDSQLRNDLRRKGIERSSHFNWTETARRVSASFDEVLNHRMPLELSSKPRVALLTEIMSPYRIPVFNEIAKDRRLDLEVIFFSETVRNRKWEVFKDKMQFAYRVIPGLRIPVPERFGGFPVFLSPNLFQVLRKMDPDVVICGGYHHPSFLLAALYSKLFRKRLLLWCETHLMSVRFRDPVSLLYRKTLVKSSSAYIAPGQLAAQFLEHLGADRSRIFVAPNAVDNDSFSQAALSFRSQKRRLKKDRGWPECLILYVGRLIHSKGIPVLLEAFSKLPRGREVGLVLVGDGIHEKGYRKYCQERKLENVFFEGFKQQNELPFYYGIADIMIFPSMRDEWGLVVNEAMASSLPVIASDRAGATHDLVEHGVNGYRFSAGKSDELAHWLTELLENEALRHRMGKHSLEIIQRFSPRRCAEGFLGAIFETRLQ